MWKIVLVVIILDFMTILSHYNTVPHTSSFLPCIITVWTQRSWYLVLEETVVIILYRGIHLLVPVMKTISVETLHVPCPPWEIPILIPLDTHSQLPTWTDLRNILNYFLQASFVKSVLFSLKTSFEGESPLQWKLQISEELYFKKSLKIERCPVFTDQRINIVKIIILQKAICRFNAIPTKIPQYS